MSDLVETVGDLEQGQAVRLTFADGTVVEARVNQFDYSPDEHLRLELATDLSGDRGRYQAFASAEGGEWSPLRARHYDAEGDEWTDLGEVADVAPLDATQFRESEDDPGRRT